MAPSFTTAPGGDRALASRRAVHGLSSVLHKIFNASFPVQAIIPCTPSSLPVALARGPKRCIIYFSNWRCTPSTSHQAKHPSCQTASTSPLIGRHERARKSLRVFTPQSALCEVILLPVELELH